MAYVKFLGAEMAYYFGHTALLISTPHDDYKQTQIDLTKGIVEKETLQYYYYNPVLCSTTQAFQYCWIYIY